MSKTIKETKNFTSSIDGVVQITNQGKLKLFHYLKVQGYSDLYRPTLELLRSCTKNQIIDYYNNIDLHPQGLLDGLKNLASHTAIGEFIADTRKNILDAQKTVKKVDVAAEYLNSVLPTLTKEAQDIMRTFKIVSDLRTFFMYLLDVASFLMCLYYQVPMPLIISTGARLLLDHLSPFASTLLKEIIKNAKDFSTLLVPQGKTNTITGLVEFARSLIGIQQLDDKDVVVIIQKMRSQIGLIKDTKVIWNLIISVYNSVMHYFRPDLYKDVNGDLLKDWEIFSVQLNKPDFEKRYGTDPIFASDLRQKYDQIVHMRKAFMDADIGTRERYKMMSYTYTGAMTLIGSLENSFKNRIKPVIVHFHGAAGSGKSTLVALLADELHRLLNNVSNDTVLNPTQILYSVNLNDKFRDSYNCQTVWYYDDPNQNKDVDVLMDFFTELIQVGNDIPYKLDCSSLEGKAGTYFASPFAMFTTNGDLTGTLQSVDTKLQSKEAVRRRITFEVEVKTVPGQVGKERYKLFVRQYDSKDFAEMTYRDFLIALLTAYAANVNDKKLVQGKNGTTDEMRDIFTTLVPQGYLSHYWQKRFDYNPGNRRIDWLSKVCLDLGQDPFNFYHEVIDHLYDYGQFADLQEFYDWKFSPGADINALFSVYCLPFTDATGARVTNFSYNIKLGPGCPQYVAANLQTLVLRTGQNVVAPNGNNVYVWDPMLLRLLDRFANGVTVGNVLMSKAQFVQHITTTVTAPIVNAANAVQNAGVAAVNVAQNVATTSIAIYNSMPPLAQWWMRFSASFIATRVLIEILHATMKFWFAHQKAKKKKTVSQEFEEATDPQVDYPKDFQGNRNARLPKNVPRKVQQGKMETQGESEKDVVTKNLWHASWADHIKYDHHASLRAFFIKDGFCVVPKHFFFQRRQEKYLRLIRFDDLRGVLIPFDYVIENSVCVGDEDLILIDCGKFVQGRDITSHLISDKEASTLVDERLELRIKDFEKPTKVVSAKAIFSKNPVEYHNQEDIVFQLSHSFRFAYKTERGMCGTPYVLEKSNFKGCVVGIHVAGDSVTGLGCVFTKDMFYRCVAFMKTEPQSTTQGILDSVAVEEVPRLVIPSKAKFVKVVPKSESIFIPNKTSIEKNTDFYGLLNEIFEIPENRMPAALRPFKHEGEIINPLQVAVNKIGDAVPPIEEKYLKIYNEVGDLYVKTWPIGKRIEPMRESEILNGIPGTSFKSINMRKSAGINYQKSTKPGKFTYIYCVVCNEDIHCGCTQKDWVLTGSARRSIEEMEEKIRKGEKVPIVYQGCLKDELRPIPKVLAGKTRLFSVGSFELLYLVRKYFGHFMEVFVSNPIQFGSGIGINPHSMEWKTLFEFLAVWKKVIAADAEGWDYSIQLPLIMKAIELYNVWYRNIFNLLKKQGLTDYSEEQFEIDQRCRTILGLMSHGAYLLVGDILLYMELVFSGHPMTGITNTIINNIATRAAVVIHYDNKNITPSVVFQNFRMTATGDDIVATHCFSDYTNQNHADAILKLGIKLTPFNKEGVFKDFYTLDEVDYLKRKFLEREGLVFAPLSKESLIGAINWKHVGMSNRTAAKANFECMLVESMHHGREFYETLRIIITDHYASTYRDVENNILPSVDYQTMVDKMQHGLINMEFAPQSGSDKAPVKEFSPDDIVHDVMEKSFTGSANRTKHKIANKKNAKIRKYEGKSAQTAMQKSFGPNSGENQGGKYNIRRIVKPDGKQYIITKDGALIYEKTINIQQPSNEPKKTNPFIKRTETPIENKKETKQTKTYRSEKEMIDDEWAEKPNKFLKDPETIQKELEKKAKIESKNKEDKNLEAIEKLVPNLHIEEEELQDDGVAPYADYDEQDCDKDLAKPPITEKKFYRVQPYSMELNTRLSTPDMTKQSRSIKLNESRNSIATTQIAKPSSLPNVKDRTRSHFKRIFRPQVPGDKQATTLLRYLGLDYESMMSIFRRNNIHHYRSDAAFKNTNLHFSYINLVEMCKKYNLRFHEESLNEADTTIPGLTIIIKSKDVEVCRASAFDTDIKNTKKFAYWNALTELSLNGFDCGTFAQSNTGEKLPVSDVTEMSSLNTKVQEENTDVVSSSNQTGVDIIRKQDPYVDMTPSELLERQLLIFSAPISSASPFLHEVFKAEVPSTFTGIPFWAELLQRFNRSIFDVEIEARMNANMMQQGLLLWTYSPGLKPADTRANNPFTAPMQILQDVTTSPTIKFTIRGVTFKHGFDQRATLGDNAYIGGIIGCHVMSPIRESNSSAPLSVLITVYAKLVNVRGMGFRTQSRITKEDLPKKVQEMAMPAKEKISENVAKAKGGISATLDTLSEVSSLVSVIPQAAPFASSLSALTGLAGSVTRYFGMSNSRDVSGPGPALPRSVPILSTNHGTVVTDVHALAVDSMISTDSTVIGDEIDYNLYDNFKLRPALSRLYTLTPASPLGAIVTFPVGPQFEQLVTTSDFIHSPSQILAEMHQLWRGGMKYKFVVVCNRFVSFRLRVYWRPNGTQVLTPSQINVSNFANRIINITGPTTFEIMVPYLGLTPALYTDNTSADTTCNGYLTIELLTTVQVQGTVPVPIDILIWSSCAEDVIFTRPKQYGLTIVQSGMDGNDLVSNFRTMFDPIIDSTIPVIDKVTFSDVASSFTERLSKPSYWKTVTVTPSISTTLPPNPVTINLNELNGGNANAEMFLINCLFSAQRGSYNLYFIPRTVSNFRFVLKSSTGYTTTSDGPFGVEPSSYGDHQNKQIIVATIPYQSINYYRQPFFTESEPLINQVQLFCYSDSSVTPIVVDVLVALGEDYTLGHATTCPTAEV